MVTFDRASFCHTVRLRGMETELMETILRFASVSLSKIETDLGLVVLTVCFTYRD